MKTQKLKEIVIYNVILSLINTFFSFYIATALSNITKTAIDDSIPFAHLIFPILRFALISLGIIVIRGLISHFSAKRAILVRQNMKAVLYQDYFSLSPSDMYENRDAGEVLESFRHDFETVVNLHCNIIPSIIVSGASYVFYLVYVGITDWLSCILFFVLSQLQLIVPLLIAPKFYNNYEEGRECEAKATNVEIEAHTGFKDINIFNLQNWYSKYLEKYQNGSSKIAKKQEYLIGTGTSLETLVASVIKYGTYPLVGLFVLYKRIPIEMAVMLLLLSNNIYTSLLNVYEKLVDFSENRMAKIRIKRITEPQNRSNTSPLCSESDTQLKNCTVTADGHTILDIGSVTILSDFPNVIVGENGSGKSTLLKVLGGFILPEECKEISAAEGNGINALYLPQDDLLLQENALELVDGSEQSRLIQLCTDKFDLTEEKLSQPIRTLSGGERKKVYLAIALLKRGDDYLLLDEPTNHLDSHTKKSLAEMICENPRKTIVVTHDNEFLSILKQITEINLIGLTKGDGNATYK